MKKKAYSRMWLLFSALMLLSVSLLADPIPIRNVLRDAPQNIGKIVEVEGLVYQLIEPQNNFNNYLIRDDFGTSIKIHTDGKNMPATNKKYNVQGYLVIDIVTSQPYIMETVRRELASGEIVRSEVDQSELQRGTQPGQVDPVIVESFWDKYFLYIVIVGGVLIIFLILVLVFRRRPVEVTPVINTTGPQSSPEGFKAPEREIVTFKKDDLNTMVIPKDMPKTLKFIPAEMEIIKGADSGKKFKVAGFPREDGSSVVTIGREVVEGPSAYAHIQLKERTISRKQAELSQKDAKVFIKNLSETNYTKVNGEELAPNTSKELTGGEIIGFGEVEMKFIKA